MNDYANALSHVTNERVMSRMDVRANVLNATMTASNVVHVVCIMSHVTLE